MYREVLVSISGQKYVIMLFHFCELLLQSSFTMPNVSLAPNLKNLWIGVVAPNPLANLLGRGGWISIVEQGCKDQAQDPMIDPVDKGWEYWQTHVVKK